MKGMKEEGFVESMYELALFTHKLEEIIRAAELTSDDIKWGKIAEIRSYLVMNNDGDITINYSLHEQRLELTHEGMHKVAETGIVDIDVYQRRDWNDKPILRFHGGNWVEASRDLECKQVGTKVVTTERPIYECK